MTVPKEIKGVGEFDEYIHALIVATPGFGKTVFAGTAPNALFLSTDPEGTVSARAFGSKAKEWRIRDWDEINKAFRYLRDGGIDEMGLKWVIIDNAAESQNLGMSATMQGNRKGGNGKRDEFVPGLDEHQRNQYMFLDMVKRFHDLPVNILWTSWRQTEEGSDGESYFTSAIHGQKGAVAQTFQGYMNVVGFGEVITTDDDREIRRIYFSNRKPYMGKDRYNVLGRYKDGYDMVQLTDAIAAAKAAPAGAAVSKTRRPAARRSTSTKARTSTRTRKA